MYGGGGGGGGGGGHYLFAICSFGALNQNGIGRPCKV